MSSVLVTKTFFLQAVYKYINVLYYHHLARKLPQSDFTVKHSLLKKTFELTYTFLSNADNSVFFLQSDFLSNLSLLNDTQLIYSLTLIRLALSNIATSNYVLPSHSAIFPFITAVLLKSTNYELLNHLLKVLVLLSTIAFVDASSFLKKARSVCKLLFKHHTAIKAYIAVMTSDSNDNLQTTKRHIEKIVKKYMVVMNFAFSDSRVVVDEMPFLGSVLTRTQIKRLLYHKTINIRLRKEVIEFMRNVYMNTVLDMRDVGYYKSVLMNSFAEGKQEEEGMELGRDTKFDSFVIKSSVNHAQDVEVDGNVVKYELLNFQEVLVNVTHKLKVKMYIESVVACFMVHFEKFCALVYDMNGYNYLSLYEMLYYFLQMKKYIYNRPDVFGSDGSHGMAMKYNEFIMNDLFLVHTIAYVNATAHSQVEFTLEQASGARILSDTERAFFIYTEKSKRRKHK